MQDYYLDNDSNNIDSDNIEIKNKQNFINSITQPQSPQKKSYVAFMRTTHPYSPLPKKNNKDISHTHTSPPHSSSRIEENKLKKNQKEVYFIEYFLHLRLY
jgi:hypothetical protein